MNTYERGSSAYYLQETNIDLTNRIEYLESRIYDFKLSLKVALKDYDKSIDIKHLKALMRKL